MIKLLVGKEVVLTDVEAYVTVYKPVAGFKAVFMSKDEDCGGMHTPWQTGMWAFGRRLECIGDALLWADAEEVPFFLVDPTKEEMDYIIDFIKKLDAETVVIEDTLFETVKETCFPCNRNTCEGCTEGGK